ncbi:FecR family protein [Bacteroides ovatus]|uniref:FecR family protein n=1 Tax=Bacteroides ovatus TaxID=28116 RepID=UPI0018987440|nr:FecR domain-containing protein [Bacteroides ovatus]
MINQHFYIARLIARYLSDEIGEEEQAELTRWRNESPENERLFREICKEENIKQNMQKRQTFHTEDGWEGVQRKIQRHRFRHRILNICKYAAIFIFPVAIATVAIYKSGNEPQPLSQVEEQIVPGGKKAVLILDNGEAIDLKSTSGVELKEKDGTVIQVDSTVLNYQQAPARTSEKLAYNKVNVPRGGEYQLMLSDGSKVQLNSMSSIRFPVQFAQDCRLVELEGEAYFEVSKTGQPFIVQTKGMKIEVLGTTFNISAYANEEYQTTLVSGSVKVQTENGSNRILKPSEQACITPGSNQINVRNVDTAFYTSWIHGKINFKDQRLDDIMKTLARWYDMDVVYENEATKELRFGCYVNRYNEITPLVKLLEQTGRVTVTVEGKTIKIFTNH